ncbi:MAG: hypothetical protein JNM51_01595, partial [Bacteroidia bacterium]|nr:hypothetical protein [Bacteroidia bacterium]
MLKKIADIAELQFGANVSAEKSGEIPIIQGRDFNSEGIFIADQTFFTDPKVLKYTRVLKNGDILFSAKGRFFA